MKVFELFQQALQSRSNLNFMRRMSGFGVIHMLLCRLRPACFSPDTLAYISDMSFSISDVELREQATTAVLLDFRLWIYTPVEVQAEAVRQVQRLCESNPDAFR